MPPRKTLKTHKIMDRKGWLIIIICVGLLLLNNQWGADNRKRIAEQQQTTEQTDSATPQIEGDLVADDGDEYLEPEPEFRTLETAEAIFTFSTKHGGIHTVEMLDELAVGSETDHVFLNNVANSEIGAISSAPDTYIERNVRITNYTEGKSVTFVGETSTGLTFRKIYTLKEDQDAAGHAHMLQYQLELALPEDIASYPLSNLAVSLGTAAPTFARETQDKEVFFWNSAGDFESDHVGEFKSTFSADRNVLSYTEADVSMAGVMNRFFVTIVKQRESAKSTLWFKNGTLTLPDAAGGGIKPTVRGGFGLPPRTLGSGEKATFVYDIYVGPKRKTTLAKLGDDYLEVMDYGWFSWISGPFNSVLNWLHDKIYGGISPIWGWGWAIVTLTILIRIAIWPLHNKSQRTMKRMSKLQPKMKELKEKYGNDPNKLNQETMKLYRDYGINPLGGCLPMLAQIPIFFGFYKMLMFAVELRNESFLWVQDLSQPDTLFYIPLPFTLFGADAIPVNILPILMAGTMVIQMSMTPSTGDKLQRRLFMLMPLVFFFFCYNFASALALYWTTQNIFSIGQTALMKRVPEPELKKSTRPRKKSMAERVAEMREQQKRMKKAQGRVVDGDKPKKKRPPRTGG